MWVLEARKDAEKVWFPVVWEEKKDTSNIIDYDIHEEITIDASYVSNANNDTTTGMATVIPWVNAPKLLQNTSIYQNWDWNIWWITATNTIRLYNPWETTWYIRSWNLSNSYWNLDFKNKSDGIWSWLVVPKSWWYEVSMTCPNWSWSFAIDVRLAITRWYGHFDTIIYHVWQYNTSSPVETVNYNFNAWDTIYAFLQLNTSVSSLTTNPTVTFNITKL
jgi:hypothetical protein